MASRGHGAPAPYDAPLARAAKPATAALGAAVHCLGILTDLPNQTPGPARTRARNTALEQLVDGLGESRAHLANAAKLLRRGRRHPLLTDHPETSPPSPMASPPRPR